MNQGFPHISITQNLLMDYDVASADNCCWISSIGSAHLVIVDYGTGSLSPRVEILQSIPPGIPYM